MHGITYRPYHIICDITSHHIISYHITPYHIIPYNIMSYHIRPCRIISCRASSCNRASQNGSWHSISCHIMLFGQYIQNAAVHETMQCNTKRHAHSHTHTFLCIHIQTYAGTYSHVHTDIYPYTCTYMRMPACKHVMFCSDVDRRMNAHACIHSSRISHSLYICQVHIPGGNEAQHPVSFQVPSSTRWL